MTGPTPKPTTLTLLLKSHRSTSFVFAEPTSTLRSLKTTLIRFLHENKAHLELPELPESEEDVVLGATIDPSGQDVGKGFHVIDGGKKKTVKDAGLKDGWVLAWKLKDEERFLVEEFGGWDEEEDGAEGEA